MRVYITFRENSNQGAVFDYIRESIKLFIFQSLEATNEGVRNQVKKLTNKPTMRWIFQMFQAVHLVTVNGDKQVSNLTQDRQDVLKHLGQYCSRYYLMFAGG